MSLAMTGAGLVDGTSAQAASSVTDGFEGNPYDRWTAQDQPGDSLVWLGNHLQRRTGTNAAMFDAPFEVPARISREIVVDRPTPQPVTCAAEAWVKKSPSETGSPRIRMGIRTTGTSEGIYIEIHTYTLTNTTYAHASFASFDYQTPNLTVVFSVTGGIVYLDDVTVWCYKKIQ
jgi:hypothetical protein